MQFGHPERRDASRKPCCSSRHSTVLQKNVFFKHQGGEAAPGTVYKSRIRSPGARKASPRGIRGALLGTPGTRNACNRGTQGAREHLKNHAAAQAKSPRRSPEPDPGNGKPSRSRAHLPRSEVEPRVPRPPESEVGPGEHPRSQEYPSPTPKRPILNLKSALGPRSLAAREAAFGPGDIPAQKSDPMTNDLPPPEAEVGSQARGNLPSAKLPPPFPI